MRETCQKTPSSTGEFINSVYYRYKLAASATRDMSVQTDFVHHQTVANDTDDNEISTKVELTRLQQEKQVCMGLGILLTLIDAKMNILIRT